MSDSYPAQWTGQQAVVTLPGQVDEFGAGQIREELLLVINRDAIELIADMTGTVSCDHAGVDAIVRAYQRAAASLPPHALAKPRSGQANSGGKKVNIVTSRPTSLCRIERACTAH